MKIYISIKYCSWAVKSSEIFNIISHAFVYMMTSSNRNIFRVTGPLGGEFTGDRWIPLTRPVTRGFGVFFDLRLE